MPRRMAGRTTLRADGAIYTAAHALAALETGVDLTTLARALIVEPGWGHAWMG